MQELSSVPSPSPIRSSMTALKKKTLNTSSSMIRTPPSISRVAANNLMVSRLVKAEPKRLPFGAESTTSSSASATNIEEFSSQLDSPLDWGDEDMDIGVFDSQPTTDEIKIETKTKTEIHEENVVKKDIPQISELDLTSGWETIKSGTELNQTVATVDLNNTELPLVTGEDGEQVRARFSELF